MPLLNDWSSFYEIVGEAAGALIGLQFVVMTLMIQAPGMLSPEGGATYSTPTTIYFATAFFMSALMRAPWTSIWPVAIFAGAIGLGGGVYALVVARRMRRQIKYAPQLEDWAFHALLPFASHMLLLAAAFCMFWRSHAALFGVGATALLLLLIGIHNAWDIVTYHIFVNLRRAAQPSAEKEQHK